LSPEVDDFASLQICLSARFFQSRSVPGLHLETLLFEHLAGPGHLLLELCLLFRGTLGHLLIEPSSFLGDLCGKLCFASPYCGEVLFCASEPLRKLALLATSVRLKLVLCLQKLALTVNGQRPQILGVLVGRLDCKLKTSLHSSDALNT
jgi:hypothetical protein